ncbi:hypothetical protein HPB49_002887 [Dermacentor silvarum]|uniref:Uncharacterized protein n=1 Tax=Dermacentor silvarum TaxID=543639 RepID=A0ACB8DA84_DERSI|nr:hypothetical protein HPB49_002887 [Dermacentor silvarum]
MISVLSQKHGVQSIHNLNVYCPPHLQRVTFPELFYRALQAAARPHWGYHYEKAWGRELKELALVCVPLLLICTLGFTLLTDPAQPTRLGNSGTRDTCPYLSLTQNIRHVTWENREDTLHKNTPNPVPSPHHGLVSFSHQAFPPASIPTGLPGMGIVRPPHTSIIHPMHLHLHLSRRSRSPPPPPLGGTPQPYPPMATIQAKNRKLRSRIKALTAEAADYSAQLADTNWVDTCMKAAGKLSSKSTW